MASTLLESCKLAQPRRTAERVSSSPFPPSSPTLLNTQSRMHTHAHTRSHRTPINPRTRTHAPTLARPTQSLATIDKALELGINFLDTAAIYRSSTGAANEELVGKAIKVCGEGEKCDLRKFRSVRLEGGGWGKEKELPLAVVFETLP